MEWFSYFIDRSNFNRNILVVAQSSRRLNELQLRPAEDVAAEMKDPQEKVFKRRM